MGMAGVESGVKAVLQGRNGPACFKCRTHSSSEDKKGLGKEELDSGPLQRKEGKRFLLCADQGRKQVLGKKMARAL